MIVSKHIWSFLWKIMREIPSYMLYLWFLSLGSFSGSFTTSVQAQGHREFVREIHTIRFSPTHCHHIIGFLTHSAVALCKPLGFHSLDSGNLAMIPWVFTHSVLVLWPRSVGTPHSWDTGHWFSSALAGLKLGGSYDILPLLFYMWVSTGELPNSLRWYILKWHLKHIGEFDSLSEERILQLCMYWSMTTIYIGKSGSMATIKKYYIQFWD